jgi:tocopherol cyclase
MKNIRNRWRAIWNPDMYHGWGKQQRYFEGWYIKIVDATEEYAFAFIPGISKGKDGQNHAFIQVLDGKKCAAAYHRFEETAFQPSENEFQLNLGGNIFFANGINLNLNNIKGKLRFKNIMPWPKMLGAPGIMGWFSFVPFMECYHGIVSLDHHIEGQLNIDGKDIDFTGGKGYIEKDWGVSFPSAWFWLQSNHFEFDTEGGISLIASVANIPFLGGHFVGYIVGFWWKNHLYRFATYTGAMMKAALDGNHIQLAFKDSQYRLEVDAIKAGTGNLVSPLLGEMTGKVSESLQAVLNVKFYKNDLLVFEGQGRNAGLEAAGDVEKLLTDKWRR